MSDINRRNFLKVLSIGGAATTATACKELRWNPRVPIENVLPYVVQPEQIVPGLPTWYTTQCNQCSAGCGIIAKNREGRVINVEGNPEHPTSQGKICSIGLAGLQEAYSPDRYEGPTQGGNDLEWNVAAQVAADSVKAASASGKAVAWLGRYRSGASGAVVSQFASAVGGKVLLWESLNRNDLAAACKSVFGKSALPTYHLAEAQTIVSFGAEFLSTWGDNVGQGMGYGYSKDPDYNGFVGRLVCIEPRVGSTSCSADTFLSTVPGSEVGVAMALAKLVAEKNGYAGPAKALVQDVDVAAASAASGISEEKLNQVADWLSSNLSSVLPGGETTSANPTDLAIATLLLNEVAGNIGKTVVFGEEFKANDNSATYREVVELLGECKAGKVGTLFLDGLDIIFTMPPSVDVAGALDKVDQLVIFANEPNDSIGGRALALPPGTSLENWGDNEAIAGRYTLGQPTMRPLKDTRSPEDVVIAISKLLGLDAAPTQEAALEGEVASAEAVEPELDENGDPIVAPEIPTLPGLGVENFKTYLADWWKATVWTAAGMPGTFASFWIESLQRGGHFLDTPRTGASVVLTKAPDIATPTLEGPGDYNLLLFPHSKLFDGRHANRPWAQEVPDALTKFAWGTWIEVNPKTAEKLGLDKANNAVLKTEQGSINVGWFGSPGMREDTVAVVMGNGHENSGRYAKYGANPVKLITSKHDDYGNQRLTVAKASIVPGTDRNEPNTGGALTTEHRPSINHAITVAELAAGKKVNDVIHHVPVDKRLDRLASIDLYPEPAHPTYRFAMAIDLNSCTGCGACDTACFAENNIPVVGPDEVRLGRYMGWSRLSRYWEGEGEHPDVRFQPVMCQQCSHAPCEGVCPVLATYHNLDGLNAMVYNRCVGTRYCANNCPYSARRFNFHTYRWPESFNMMLNPDVVTREMGVMEKCTFCIQKIRVVKDAWRDVNPLGKAPDEVLRRLPVCAQACPSDCITFGNLNDEDSEVSKKFADPRAYSMLGELNNKPGIRYLARVVHHEIPRHHGGGHGDGHGEDHGNSHGGDHGSDHDNAGSHGDENNNGHH
jgi:molybdopterin-containing oxidoreductase family iron-sulfur binding subunit